MEKVSYTNRGKTVVYLGNISCPPGETREVHPNHIPGGAPPAEVPGEPELTDLEKQVALTVEEIVADLPMMTDEEVQGVLSVEESRGDEARSTLVAAIAAEQLKRAQE